MEKMGANSRTVYSQRRIIMAQHDLQYLTLAKQVMETGTFKSDRTGTGTKSIFDATMRFDLSDGTIPLLTTKKMHWNSIIHELLWFLSGDTNIANLNKNGVRIWNEWASDNGDLGPVYGHQWRNWPTYEYLQHQESITRYEQLIPVYISGKPIDQITILLNKLKTNPDDRRLMVSAWNVGQLDQMALPPCHYGFQIYTRLLTTDEQVLWPDQQRKISMKMTQRSADMFLGVPFNIVQYSILLHMIAKVCNMVPDTFIWSGGDIHIYSNHYNQITEQLSRIPYDSPIIELTGNHTDLDHFCFDNFILKQYQSHAIIKGKVAV